MLVVVAYHRGDAPATANLLRWIFELDGQRDSASHRLLLVAARGLEPSEREPVTLAGRAAFASCLTVQTTQVNNRPWPEAQNCMFRSAVAYINATLKCPFWWNEPDCIPLTSGWLEALEAEYRSAARPFLGAVVDRPTKHLTGCAIYPAFPERYNQQLVRGPATVAFDCISPLATLAHTHNTNLFHHQWSDWDGKEIPSFPDDSKLSRINSRAVVFHRNKDQTLIERLREQRAVGPSAEAVDEPEASVRPSRIEISNEPCESIPIGFPSHDTDIQEASQTAAATSARIPVYAYYQKVHGLPDPAPLLELWRELWHEQGWEPVVLNESHAHEQPQYFPFLKRIDRLPTVNHAEYERACYLRHLAMLGVGQSGFLVDYDVMPVRFTPADYQKAHQDNSLICFEPTRVPCALRATKRGWQRVIDYITKYEPLPTDSYQGKPHISDMEILRKTNIKTTAHCVEHLCSGKSIRDDLGDGWKKAPMIHFSTGSFHKLGLANKGQKHEWIKDALEKLKREAKPAPSKNLVPA